MTVAQSIDHQYIKTGDIVFLYRNYRLQAGRVIQVVDDKLVKVETFVGPGSYATETCRAHYIFKDKAIAMDTMIGELGLRK